MADLIPIKDIKGKVKKHFGVAVGEMNGFAKNPCLVEARSAVVFLARNAGYKNTDIGLALGNRTGKAISRIFEVATKRYRQDLHFDYGVNEVAQDLGIDIS